jgi:hypothetical protein
LQNGQIKILSVKTYLQKFPIRLGQCWLEKESQLSIDGRRRDTKMVYSSYSKLYFIFSLKGKKKRVESMAAEIESGNR